MEGSRKNGKNDRNPCLTMHQPWASLLVHGIKRIEGRSWPAPIRGRIWIHAAGKVPDAATIKAMEDFYREIYAVNGITDLEFPQQYPVSRLIGCIEVVGCLRREELAHWNEVAEGVRLEALTDYCWLCEQPKKLRVPIEMRGFHGVYELDRKICEAAMGDLIPVHSSLLVKFQLPNPQDPFSLKPGSISACFPKSKASEIPKSPSLSAAIAAASASATQYSKKGQNLEKNTFNSRSTKNFTRQWQLKSNSSAEDEMVSAEDKMVSNEVGTLACHRNEGNSGSYSKQFLHAESSHHPGPHSKDIHAFDSRNTKIFTRQWQLKSNSSAEHKMVSNELGAQPCHHNEGNRGSYPKQVLHAESSHRPGPHSKIFAAAVRGLRPG